MFPHITHLDQIRKAIVGRDEFIIAEREWGYVANYVVSMKETFPCYIQKPQEAEISALLRECRGIKFNLHGNILARPFHKFFNYGERHETMEQTLNLAGRFNDNFQILPKLDGSMIHPILVDGEILLCTKMGLSDVALNAQAFIDLDENVKYSIFCEEAVNKGYTPIFEWCSNKNRIVVPYDTDELVLTAVRHTIEGDYVTNIKAFVEGFDIPVIDEFDGSWHGIDAFSEYVGGIENAEGYVIRWDDGQMIKLKGDWYLALHRAKDGIQFEKRVINLIVHEGVDDVLPSLLMDDYNRLVSYQNDFWRKIHSVVVNLDNIFATWNTNKNIDPLLTEKEIQRDFAVNFVQHFDKDTRKFLFSMNNSSNNKTTREIVLEYISNNISSQTSVNKIRDLLPSTPWDEYVG